ncbi:hypothetical protein GCM10009738_70070 [Kitasatospora viridis]
MAADLRAGAFFATAFFAAALFVWGELEVRAALPDVREAMAESLPAAPGPRTHDRPSCPGCVADVRRHTVSGPGVHPIGWSAAL